MSGDSGDGGAGDLGGPDNTPHYGAVDNTTPPQSPPSPPPPGPSVNPSDAGATDTDAGGGPTLISVHTDPDADRVEDVSGGDVEVATGVEATVGNGDNPLIGINADQDVPGSTGLGSLISVEPNSDGNSGINVGANTDGNGLINVGDSTDGDGLIQIEGNTDSGAHLDINTDAGGNGLIDIGDNAESNSLVAITASEGDLIASLASNETPNTAGLVDIAGDHGPLLGILSEDTGGNTLDIDVGTDGGTSAIVDSDIATVDAGGDGLISGTGLSGLNVLDLV